MKDTTKNPTIAPVSAKKTSVDFRDASAKPEKGTLVGKKNTQAGDPTIKDAAGNPEGVVGQSGHQLVMLPDGSYYDKGTGEKFSADFGEIFTPERLASEEAARNSIKDSRGRMPGDEGYEGPAGIEDFSSYPEYSDGCVWARYVNMLNVTDEFDLITSWIRP